MKKVKFLLTLSLIISSSVLFAQMYVVNTANSIIEWEGKKVTGQHNGTIAIKSASLDMHDNHLHGGNFVVDMTSIVCLDIENEKYNKKLVGHLESDDFFSVETYPTATLKITDDAIFKNGKAKVMGELTIKGKTLPIEFDAHKADGKITAKIVVDRSKYDVRYGSKSFFDNLGDKMIYDDFTLNVTLAF
ncbi:MAG: lipid-binding protein [Bacteroidetes bacterium]|nr:lipid-binding protein [Bacteroidota bacterium]|tara:strand:- start:514 stop:1080 length:567 start_codon:yes stop_codon:yes gene_type:complete